MIRASDQSIIDPQGIVMQILLAADFNIVLIHKRAHSYKFYECSQSERWQTTARTDARLQNLCEFALSLSSRPFTGDAAKEFITNDSWNRGSE